jgi:hypothetical protein
MLEIARSILSGISNLGSWTQDRVLLPVPLSKSVLCPATSLLKATIVYQMASRIQKSITELQLKVSILDLSS